MNLIYSPLINQPPIFNEHVIVAISIELVFYFSLFNILSNYISTLKNIH